MTSEHSLYMGMMASYQLMATGTK